MLCEPTRRIKIHKSFIFSQFMFLVGMFRLNEAFKVMQTYTLSRTWKVLAATEWNGAWYPHSNDSWLYWFYADIPAWLAEATWSLDHGDLVHVFSLLRLPATCWYNVYLPIHFRPSNYSNQFEARLRCYINSIRHMLDATKYRRRNWILGPHSDCPNKY